MNIAHFLTPKSEVVWVPASASLARAIEILTPHRYSAVPILNEHGGYEGTLTEGDILWRLLRSESPWERALGRVPVRLVPRRTSNRPVHIDAEIETLLSRAAHQNFVPVVDDREIFIGIVRRQQIIEYCVPRARTQSCLPASANVTPDPRTA